MTLVNFLHKNDHYLEVSKQIISHNDQTLSDAV